MKKILVVEDDISIHNLIKEVLENEHYIVLNAYSGTEALLFLDNPVMVPLQVIHPLVILDGYLWFIHQVLTFPLSFPRLPVSLVPHPPPRPFSFSSLV